MCASFPFFLVQVLADEHVWHPRSVAAGSGVSFALSSGFLLGASCHGQDRLAVLSMIRTTHTTQSVAILAQVALHSAARVSVRRFGTSVSHSFVCGGVLVEMTSTKFDGGPLVGARNPDEKSVLLNFSPLKVLILVASQCIVSVHDEMKSVVCYAFVDATVRCVASAAICFQPFFAAMSSVHVAMLAASWVCPGLALFLKWLGRDSLKNHEFMSSGLSGFANDCENLLFPLKGRVFVSSGFTGTATDLESPLFPLKGHVFESSGFTGAVTDLESPLFPLKGHVFESPGLLFGSRCRVTCSSLHVSLDIGSNPTASFLCLRSKCWRLQGSW